MLLYEHGEGKESENAFTGLPGADSSAGGSAEESSADSSGGSSARNSADSLPGNSSGSSSGSLAGIQRWEPQKQVEFAEACLGCSRSNVNPDATCRVLSPKGLSLGTLMW